MNLKNKKILLALILIVLLGIVAIEAICIWKLGLASKELNEISNIILNKYINV